MKPGDLVRYSSYHKNLQHLVGLVVQLDGAGGDGGGLLRAKVLWNHQRPILRACPTWDWVADLVTLDSQKNDCMGAQKNE